MSYLVARIEKEARHKNYFLGYGLQTETLLDVMCGLLPPTACVPTTPNQSHLLLLFLRHQLKRILVIISNKPAWVMFIEQ